MSSVAVWIEWKHGNSLLIIVLFAWNWFFAGCDRCDNNRIINQFANNILWRMRWNRFNLHHAVDVSLLDHIDLGDKSQMFRMSSVAAHFWLPTFVNDNRIGGTMRVTKRANLQTFTFGHPLNNNNYIIGKMNQTNRMPDFESIVEDEKIKCDCDDGIRRRRRRRTNTVCRLAATYYCCWKYLNTSSRGLTLLWSASNHGSRCFVCFSLLMALCVVRLRKNLLNCRSEMFEDNTIVDCFAYVFLPFSSNSIT